MFLTSGTSFFTAAFVVPPGCLITMQWITLPIITTQSDFHNPVGAACSQLSGNYSPCMYRKLSAAGLTLGSHTDGLTASHT